MSEEEEYIEDIPAVDLDEIGKKYEEQGYFKRLSSMFSGLRKPKSSPEYKLARLELQRQAAPLIAIVFVMMLVVVMIVLTSMQGLNKDAYEVTIAKTVEPPPEEPPPPEDPPPDPEPTPIDVDITVDNPSPNPIDNPTPAPPAPNEPVTVKSAEVDAVAFVDSPLKMKSMTASRTATGRKAALIGGGKYGDATTEATVLKVLWWLKATQQKDGSWPSQAHKTPHTSNGSPLAATALAVLTYLAHGEYPNAPDSPFRRDFGPVVQSALDYINSCLYHDTKAGGLVKMKGTDGHEYAFLIATYALCEAFGMTRNLECKDTAMACLERIIKGQSATGGWDYNINPKSQRDDLSFAGWALQALKAGKLAGLHPDGLDECIKKAIRCLQTRSFYKGHFTYCANSRGHPGLTATGCLAMQLLGYGNKNEVTSSLDYMKGWKPTFEASEMGVGKDCPSPQYYCYYATQCKYQAGMKTGAKKNDEVIWEEWNKRMKATYPKLIKDLPDKVKDCIGQEHRQGYFLNKDNWSCGPVMDSCLVALQLMVYYRYLPTAQTSAATEVDDSKSAADTAVGKDDVKVDVGDI